MSCSICFTSGQLSVVSFQLGKGVKFLVWLITEGWELITLIRGIKMALVALNTQERRVLEETVTSAALTNEVRRAQALLWLDEGTGPKTSSLSQVE